MYQRIVRRFFFAFLFIVFCIPNVCAEEKVDFEAYSSEAVSVSDLATYSPDGSIIV